MLHMSVHRTQRLTRRAALLRNKSNNCSPTVYRRKLNRSRNARKVHAAATVEDLPLPEGSLGLPLLGENLDLILNGDKFGENRIAKYGSLWKTNILGGPTVMVYGEEDVRKVLAAEGRLVQVLWPQPATRDLVGGVSLNLLEGERHAEVKRVFSECFTERALEPLVPCMAEVVQEDLDTWAAGGAAGSSGLRRMQLMAMKVFMRVVLGLPATSEGAAHLQALMEKLQGGFLALAVPLPLLPYGQALAAREDLMAELRAAIQAAYSRGKVALQRPPAPHHSLLDLLIIAVDKDGRVLKDEELLDGLVAALFGNASSGPTLSKALQQLALNPEVLAALRAEQQNVAGGVSAAALQRMPLAEATAREVLRFRPAVPVMFRTAICDFELSGCRIPKGWQVWCYTGDGAAKYATDAFQPSSWVAASSTSSSGCPFKAAAAAFSGHSSSSSSSSDSRQGTGAASMSAAVLDQNVKVSPPEFTLPFGAGPRGCLGRRLVETQLQVLIAVLSKGYEWGVSEPEEEWALVPTPRPAGGLPMASFEKLGGM